ncbi:MAG: hypothetical protein R3C03_02360 [Pirellulaceae bacterium]
MGLERKTKARVGRKVYEGKLHLDSKLLTFHSKDIRIEFELTSNLDAIIADEWLKVSLDGCSASFLLGDQCEKWLSKIKNPPDLIQKLGLKPRQTIWFSKGFDGQIKKQARDLGAKVVKAIVECDLAFLEIKRVDDLDLLIDVLDDIAAEINVWVIWPKGQKQFGQSQVMTICRERGFGPSKTASIDENRSSMRFAKRK